MVEEDATNRAGEREMQRENESDGNRKEGGKYRSADCQLS